ncbi:phospholipid scramblase 1 [Patella vulgata]|uniref:phospholipid scramblase 1 n=1 Tax=Patella vulgata TaxID=6465 RepID=UPI002180789C|nr:phospholipid scramblase 1 [Patella vulgata]
MSEIERLKTAEKAIISQPKGNVSDDYKFRNENGSETKNGSDFINVLTEHNEIIIHQLLDVVEVLLGWQRNSRYQILDKEGNQIIYIFEVADCYARQCLGGMREFSMKATDDDGVELLSVHRPLRCTSRCCWICCNLQELEIFSPPGNHIATIKEIWTCLIPTYTIVDPTEQELYKMVGECCRCKLCSNNVFKVLDTGGEVVCTVSKIWGGCKDIIGASNDYTVQYNENLSAHERTIILGATFLVDFNYFEKHGRCW